MVVKYYHLRNEYNEPRLTRCIIKDGNSIAIGTSLCSDLDFPDKKNGRTRAFGRATSALKHKKNLFPIERDEALAVLLNVEADLLDYKDTFNHKYYRDYKGLYFEDFDKLNDLEKKLLEKEI